VEEKTLFDRRRRWKFMFIIFSGLMVYLWINLQVIYSGIAHKRLQEQKTILFNRHKDLKMEYIDVVSARSVEKYAADNLGLINPSEKQFRYIR